MSRPFDVRLPLEQGYLRRALFAVELIDAVTMERVTYGVTVRAEGLSATPVVNTTGYFVWLHEDVSRLRKLSIDPGALPYEHVERTPAELSLPPAPRPLTTIELPARIDYAFAPGITGTRGVLIESRVGERTPIAGAEVRLLWLDGDNVWRASPTISHTTANGDFVSVLRLAPADVPKFDAGGAITVRLWGRRDGAIERRSADFKLLQGHVAAPLTLNALTFAWDELQP